MSRRSTLLRAMAFGAALVLPSAAHAQLFRAYLDPDGLDTNPCTLQAPCRLLPAALAAVADGGEIWMLDSANYNVAPVSITKSVSILAVPGAVGSLVATNGGALLISAPGARVALRNLAFVRAIGALGAVGINVTSAARLTLERCVLANLPTTALFAQGVMALRIVDSTIRGNGYAGMQLANGVRATISRSVISGNGSFGMLLQGGISPAVLTTSVDISDSTLEGNGFGIEGGTTSPTATVRIAIRDSRIVGNSSVGLAGYADPGAGPVSIVASRNDIVANGTGILVSGAQARALAIGNTVSGNNIGIDNTGTGVLESAGDNAVRGNLVTQVSGTLNAVTPR